MKHELVFYKKIPIKYIIGIICANCEDKFVYQIKNYLKQIELDVPVYTDNSMISISNYM